MKSQKQPNRWSCLPTAFAILLDIPVDDIIKAIGHDGSEVIDSSQPEPLCRRGFHIQELIHYCYDRGYMVTIFEPVPSFENYTLDMIKKVEQIMTTTPGIIMGIVNNQYHTATWDMEKVIDPNGTTYNLDQFELQYFIKVSPSYHGGENSS